MPNSPGEYLIRDLGELEEEFNVVPANGASEVGNFNKQL